MLVTARLISSDSISMSRMEYMVDRSITMDDVAGRSRVQALVMTDANKALKVARAIRHPWYRCQSLSTVAEHWGTAAQRMAVLNEAVRAAEEQAEINRIVTVASWPLRVMASIDADATSRHLRRMVELANQEAHTLRRADALFSLAGAVSDRRELLAKVVPSLAESLLQSYGWRTDRLIEFSVDLVKAVMPEVLGALVAHHRPGRKKQRLEDSLAANPTAL